MSKNTNLSFLTDFLTADIVNSRVGMNNVSPQATFDVTGTGKFSGILTLGSTVSNGTYTYTLPSATGTLALTSDIPSVSGYVPYTGATQAVNLGYNSLSTSFLRIDGEGPTLGSYLGFKHSTNVTTGADGYTSIYTFGTNRIAFKSISGATTRDFSFSMASITPGISGGRTYTLPDADGTIALTSSLSGYLPLTGGILTGTTRMDGSGGTVPSITMIYNSGVNRLLAPLLRLYGATNESSNYIELFGSSATSNRTINFPDASGTVALTSQIPANPVGGTGTSGTIPVFTGSTTIGNSIIQSNATQVNIVGNGSQLLFDSLGESKTGGIWYVNDFQLLINNSRGTGSSIYLGNVNMDFHTNASSNPDPRLRIDSTGNVGIGTSTPTSSFNARLAVRNEDAANNPTLTLFKNISSGSAEDIFRVQSWNGAFNTVASIKANGSAIFSGDLGVGRIPSSGYKVDIQGNGGLRILDNDILRSITILPPTSSSQGVVSTASGQGISFQATNASGNLFFETAGNERMRITSGGNVMIGLSTDNGYKLYVNGLVGTSSSVTANNYIANQEGLSVSNFGFLSQTISGQMTILGHNVRASNSVGNQVNVVNGGWISSMIKMYYTEGITFHTSPTTYSAGAVYPMDTTTERVRIQTDGQVRFQSSIILTNGQINSLTSAGSGQPMYLNFGGNGAIYAGSSYAVLYAGSDERIKTEINHSQSTLTKILNLTPRTFKYKERPEITNYGFIAQEVEKIMPELVRTSEGITMCLNEQIENQKSVESYGLAWAAILVKAIQELKQQLDTLTNENN